MVKLSKHVVKFGRAKGLIYRREDLESNSWYFRMYLKDEGRYIRKSLGTTDIREAQEFAEAELVDILAKKKAGAPIISPTFTEICRDFMLDDEKELAAGMISKSTQEHHTHYIRWVSKYVAEKFPAGIRTRLSDIDAKKDFADYLTWRMAQGKVRRDTIRAELVGIRMVFKLAVKNGKALPNSIPEWDFEVEDSPQRERINVDTDYPKVLTVLKAWVKKAKRDVEIYDRELLHHVFLIMAQCGMRTGECLQLKWSDIQSIENGDVTVRVRKETSKVRKDRDVLIPASTGGKKSGKPINYLIRWRDQFARHKGENDFIFALFTKPDQYGKEPFYRGYMSLREDLKEIGMEWWDAYHNRHLFASKAVIAGVPLAVVANALGNSPAVVSKHYSHLLSAQSAKTIHEMRRMR